jgi:uncharacterized protein YjdB
MQASRSFAGLLLLSLFLLSDATGQFHPGISLTVVPSESTLQLGQTQAFTAIVMGTSDAAIQWSVQEPNGGTVTEDGIYTAPHEIGIYHVLVLALSKGLSAQTVAKVTVVELHDAAPAK